jgi:hypothetical protein
MPNNNTVHRRRRTSQYEGYSNMESKVPKHHVFSLSNISKLERFELVVLFHETISSIENAEINIREV